MRQARYDRHYAPQIPGLLAPFDPRLVNAVVLMNTNEARLARGVAARTGKLRKLAIYVGGQSGNIDVGIYSTLATRARLGSSGTQPCPAVGWQLISLTAPVDVQQGMSYELAMACDNNVATFGHFNGAQVGQLPTGWWPVTGGQAAAAPAAPKTNPRAATSFPLPATIAEAALIADSGRVFFIGGLVESS